MDNIFIKSAIIEDYYNIENFFLHIDNELHLTDLPLPCDYNSYGHFYLSNEEINKIICSEQNRFEKYNLENEEKISSYIYETRYSRYNKYNIKMDEYTLRRNNDFKKKNVYDNTSHHNINSIINYKKSDVNKKSNSNKYFDDDNNIFIFNMYKKKMEEKKNIERYNPIKDDNIYRNILFEHSQKNIMLREKYMSKNVIAMNNPYGTHFFTYPSYILNNNKKEKRKIPNMPYRILSAPELIDDFYLNLLDWSKKNIIATALSDKLYLWNNNTCTSQKLFVANKMDKDIEKNDKGEDKRRNKYKNKKRKNEKSNNDKNNDKCELIETIKPLEKIKPQKTISSLKWNNINGNFLATGLSNGVVEIWDVEKSVRIRKYKNHKLRVNTLCWNHNILTSGGRDNKIINSDIRSKEIYYIELTKHKSEICGLEWNTDGTYLASGSNDNSIYIWDKYTNKYLFHFLKHKAAVKAISWCPYKNHILASGGGSVDKKIFLWNIKNGKSINEIYTKSQVSNIIWSINTREIISTHSNSLNQIILWNLPQLKKVTTLKGHKLRVLHAALSPDGTSIATGSPDQTIRLWNIFPKYGDKNISLFFPISNCYNTVR
ncbi:cell division cycle protein 20-like protein [Plasmodium gaboni]|uniref:Cell division cycle protein 20-like protein n=1 Tax=Plasmodium gaboni TaxID=647221 RepID=A0A151LL65_9APIC|nr:cell division cycle protein 20-like protein [Plasmodium gaboni]KYN99646.1 cell division cycle protein 20-like protein [Plasmodium gaboni]